MPFGNDVTAHDAFALAGVLGVVVFGFTLAFGTVPAGARSLTGTPFAEGVSAVRSLGWVSVVPPSRSGLVTSVVFGAASGGPPSAGDSTTSRLVSMR